MKVKIKCPECQKTINGKIEKICNMPFYSYYGYCKKCDYDITESEFEEVE